MKYLKSINELFDNEDIKNVFEIPYLSGTLQKDMSEWGKVHSYNEGDKDMVMLIMENPYLHQFSYIKSGNSVSLGFNNVIKNDIGNIYYYCLIEIIKFKDKYNLNSYTKSYVNGERTYDKSLSYKDVSYDELAIKIRSEVFKMVKEFNDYTIKMFGKSNLNLSEISINPILN